MADPNKGDILMVCTICKGTGIVQRPTYSKDAPVVPEEECSICEGEGEYKWGRIVDI